MKKISTLFVFAAIAFSTQGYAAVLNTANGITTADCDVLSDDVKPALSKNVVLAYSCNKNQNVVKVAACHQFGSRKIETVACQATGNDPATGNTTYNNPSCTGAADQTFQTGNFGKAYTGSSSGGSVAASSMTAACDAAGTALGGFVQ
ncbi:Uncharacterised protein [Streptococcus pneumoniae]|nr:hypothetical protein [Pseudomonas sp. JI-2]CJL42339.1 Uncharacterised protein [Streptococcus pneumoniae]